MGTGCVEHNKADLRSSVQFDILAANKVAVFRAASFAFQTRLTVTSGIFPPHSLFLELIMQKKNALCISKRLNEQR